MRDPNECPNWTGNPEGCDCSWCIAEAMEESMGVVGDNNVEEDDECPYCDFGCSSCDPLIDLGGEA